MRVAAVFLRALALLLVGLTFVFLAPAAQADCPHQGKTDHPHCTGGTPSGDQDVFVLMDDTDGDVTLATAGPLEVFARCGTDANARTVEILVTSSEAGWFVARSPTGPRAAGEEVLMTQTGDSVAVYRTFSDSGAPSAVSPSGHYIGLDDSLGLGVDMFGFDCLVAGQIMGFPSALADSLLRYAIHRQGRGRYHAVHVPAVTGMMGPLHRAGIREMSI